MKEAPSAVAQGCVLCRAVLCCAGRDIKPENCMIEAATQRLKLIDFGLSKVSVDRLHTRAA
jgi:hypothetical protein